MINKKLESDLVNVAQEKKRLEEQVKKENIFDLKLQMNKVSFMNCGEPFQVANKFADFTFIFLS